MEKKSDKESRLKRFAGAFQKEFDIGGETLGEAYRAGRKAQGKIAEGTDFGVQLPETSLPMGQGASGGS